MTIRVTIPTTGALNADAIIRRLRDDIQAAKRRGLVADIKALLAGELEDLKIETLAKTRGGLDAHPLLTP